MKQTIILVPFLLAACTVNVSGPVTGVGGSLSLNNATPSPTPTAQSPSSATPTPSPTPDTSQPQYVGMVVSVVNADDNGYGQLSMAELDADGTIKSQSLLRDGSGKVIKGAEPIISPDGRRIAFVDYSETSPMTAICTVDSNGRVQTVITASVDTGFNLDPNWSADSTELAFVSDRGGNYDVYRVLVGEGNTPTRITNTAVNERFPAWNPSFAPDRVSTMVVSAQANDVFGINSGGSPAAYNLFLINRPDGRYLKQLTNLSDMRDYAFETQWRADGLAIAYTRNGPILDSQSDSNRYQRIYIQDVTKNAGSGVLLNRSEVSASIFESSPTWNQTNNQIAYLKSYSSNLQAAQAQVWRQSLTDLVPSTDSPRQWTGFTSPFPAIWFSGTMRRPFSGRSLTWR